VTFFNHVVIQFTKTHQGTLKGTKEEIEEGVNWKKEKKTEA
jgi:hypothetical protein